MHSEPMQVVLLDSEPCFVCMERQNAYTVHAGRALASHVTKPWRLASCSPIERAIARPCIIQSLLVYLYHYHSMISKEVGGWIPTDGAIIIRVRSDVNVVLPPPSNFPGSCLLSLKRDSRLR